MRYVFTEKVVFTDLRLSAILVAGGHLKVIGPEDPPSTSYEIIRDRIRRIFYQDDPMAAIQSLYTITSTTKESFDYLFFSIRMTKPYPEPGIRLYGSSIAPAIPNFLEKLNKIHTNFGSGSGSIVIYFRNSG